MRRTTRFLVMSGLGMASMLGCDRVPIDGTVTDPITGEAKPAKPKSNTENINILPIDNVNDFNVTHTTQGWVAPTPTQADVPNLWVANKDDWSRGTVSKVDQKTNKETARYLSVTCKGNNAPDKCKDTTGGYVQQSENHPSRTAIGLDGRVFVANRAFGGGQGSVTAIAANRTQCADRNGNNTIETSFDRNGDGLIQTDCNNNGLLDDGTEACAEFYGLNDECVLWTTNIDAKGQIARPLAVNRSNNNYSRSEVWAGSYSSGNVYKLNGETGDIEASSHLPGNLYGFAVDDTGRLWATAVGSGKLMWLNTANPADQGTIRQPVGFALGGYGIAIDKDKNIWLGGYGSTCQAFRYAPSTDKWNCFFNGKGSGNGRGVAVDAKHAYVARDGGHLLQIPRNAGNLNSEAAYDISSANSIAVEGSSTIGAGIGAPGTVWAVSLAGSRVNKIDVAPNGNLSLNGTARNLEAEAIYGTVSHPNPYSYSDFTGYGVAQLSGGVYQYDFTGARCGTSTPTWQRLSWNVAINYPTSNVAVDYSFDGVNWSSVIGASYNHTSQTMNQLSPELHVRFTFSTSDAAVIPALKKIQVQYTCPPQ